MKKRKQNEPTDQMRGRESMHVKIEESERNDRSSKNSIFSSVIKMRHRKTRWNESVRRNTSNLLVFVHDVIWLETKRNQWFCHAIV